MNCTQAEHLIPLFTGGDLQPLEADGLRQHIKICLHCQQMAEEFAASQAWLSEFAAPAFDPSFDNAVFANLRASVRREIEQMESAGEGTTGGNWFGWLLPQWNLRFVITAAIVLLALLGGLAAAYRHRTPSQDVVIKAPSSKTGVHKPSPTPQHDYGTGSVSDLPLKPPATDGTTSPSRSPYRNHSPNRPVQAPQRVVPDDSASTAITAQVTPGVEPTTEPARSTDVAKAGPEMLRIEFQTADPNIRIIWFAPKAGKTEPNTK